MTTDLEGSREAWKRTRGEWKRVLTDFLVEKMWVKKERGRATAAEEEEELLLLSGSQRRRWVVRMRRPDLRRGKLGMSSHSRSTAERMEHSISFWRNTGRPLLVRSALGREFVAIDDNDNDDDDEKVRYCYCCCCCDSMGWRELWIVIEVKLM